VPGTDRYRILIDPAASADAVPWRFEIPAGMSIADVTDVLDVIFRADSRCDAVVLAADGHAVGTVTRTRFHSLVAPTGPHRGDRPVGSGDGATLAGPPVSYEVFTYRCPHCGTVVYRIEADMPSPACGQPGHGRMDLEA
jgi:hypothetical protein